VLVICSFDSTGVQWGNTVLDMPALGMDWHETFEVVDQITGSTYEWGQHNAVRIDPYVEPAHIFVVQPRK
jgi:starch synthase (maltosyl-transferring)